MNKYIKYIFLFVGFSLFAQTKSERAEITKNYDQVPKFTVKNGKLYLYKIVLCS